MTPREKTLEAVLVNSEVEHQRILKVRAESGSWDNPLDPANLYVWQLEVLDFTSRGTHKYTKLFASREGAVKWACEKSIKPHYIRESGWSSSEEVLELYQAGKFEELVAYVGPHLQFHHNLSVVAILAG